MASNKIKNTVDLINNFKGNKDEFNMLKGILCANHKLNSEDTKAFNGIFDTLMIAERLDTLNRDSGSYLHKA